MQPWRIVMQVNIVGAGGVGGYLAVHLIRAGHQVRLLARGPHLEAIRTEGLRLFGPDTDLSVSPEAATADPGELSASGLTVFAVKGQDLEAAADAVAPVLSADAQVLPFQNGVAAADVLAARFGQDRTLVGVARIFANITSPGTITLKPGPKAFVIGNWDGLQSDPTVDAIRTVFSDAGIDVPETPNVLHALWTKFMLFAAASSVTAGARANMGEIRAIPELTALFAEIVREVEAIAAAKGIGLPADAGDKVIGTLAGFDDQAATSMAHDLSLGKPLELDQIAGTVVRMGQEHQIPTPATRTVYALLCKFRGGA